jgi:hypothetical protein
MRRALHIGIFIGTLIGMSACASVEPTFASACETTRPALIG